MKMKSQTKSNPTKQNILDIIKNSSETMKVLTLLLLLQFSVGFSTNLMAGTYGSKYVKCYNQERCGHVGVDGGVLDYSASGLSQGYSINIADSWVSLINSGQSGLTFRVQPNRSYYHRVAKIIVDGDIEVYITQDAYDPLSIGNIEGPSILAPGEAAQYVVTGDGPYNCFFKISGNGTFSQNDFNAGLITAETVNSGSIKLDVEIYDPRIGVTVTTMSKTITIK